MLKTFSLYNEYEIRKWDAFVKAHPKGSPFHLSNWIRIIKETYSFIPLLYIDKNQAGDVCGIFPFFLIKDHFTGPRIVSLPFSDYCGPLFKDENHEKEILSEIIKKNGHHVKYIEIRDHVVHDSSVICYNYFKRHILNLDLDLSNVRKMLAKRTIQYSIRKAKRKGVEIIEENSHRGVKEFCRLNILTRKRHGIPNQPQNFFFKMFDYMISKGYAFILLAVYDSKVIAATVFLKFKETIYYKYNASDPQYLSRITPNHLLIWYAIEKAYHAGYSFFDFGRTSPDNHGLMRYKEMWGAKCFDLPYFYYPKIKGINVKNENSLYYRILTNIWRFLPNSISSKVGPTIYKHLA